MSTSGQKNWASALAWGLLLLIAGAALATWALARWDGAARVLGVNPQDRPVGLQLQSGLPSTVAVPTPVDTNLDGRLASVEARLRNVEGMSQQTAGSVGRADALLVAFATRRAIDRGVALGYLEPLLSQKFGQSQPRAVATIVTAGREPVTLEALTRDYRALEPELRKGAPDEGVFTRIGREMGSLVSVRRASAPSPASAARYERALDSLREGAVDAALAETLRMPAAPRAKAWTDRARRYVATHRALDTIESAALLSGGR